MILCPPPLFKHSNTYILGDRFDILVVLNQGEDGAWSWAVRVGVPRPLTVHDSGLAEGTEVDGVDDAVLVALAADELAECRPNPRHLSHLISLSCLSNVKFLGRGVDHWTWARQYLGVQFLAEVCKGTLAHK